MKIIAFCDVVLYSLRCFRGAYCFHHQGDDGGSMHLWNVSLLQQGYMTLYPRRLVSSIFSSICKPICKKSNCLSYGHCVPILIADTTFCWRAYLVHSSCHQNVEISVYGRIYLVSLCFRKGHKIFSSVSQWVILPLWLWPTCTIIETSTFPVLSCQAVGNNLHQA
jgi:hypothetical protein